MAPGLDESRPYLPKAPGLTEDADATGADWDECVGYTVLPSYVGSGRIYQSLDLKGLKAPP